MFRHKAFAVSPASLFDRFFYNVKVKLKTKIILIESIGRRREYAR
jgi:hypothetical protein